MDKDESSPAKRQKVVDSFGDGLSACCIKVDGSNKPSASSDVLTDYPTLLPNLLAPLDPEVILKKYFRNCAVHISGNVERFESISKEHLFDLTPESIYSQTASEEIFVWLRMPDNQLIHSIEVSDPAAALALHKAGNATYCRAPPLLEQLLVPALLQDTGLGCGQYHPESPSSWGRGEIEVFISTQDHKTDWHMDFQENFTLQLSGTKKWSLQKGTIRHPLRGCTPHYNSPDTVGPQLKAARLVDPTFQFEKPTAGVNAIGEVETVILKPGDVLYHPAGIWHKIEAMEPGVSINVSLMATTYASVACRSLEHLLLQQENWRQCICNNGQESVVDKLNLLLQELPGIIQKFERDGGGAQAIIPPVLRNGTINDIRSNDDEQEGEEASDDDDDDEGSTEFFETNDIINGDSFRSPSVQLDTGNKMILSVNPLAVLIDEADIERYYKSVASSKVKDEKTNNNKKDQVLVLNVNYAGTESHESCVRVAIRTSRFSKVETLLNKPLSPKQIPDDVRPLLACLLHYGYLYQKLQK